MWMGPELYSKCGAFVRMLNFFFTFLLKDTEEQRLIFCFCIFFFLLLVLEKLNKNFRI